MRRTQIQLDDDLYEALRRRAFEERRSLAAVVRDLLAQAMGRTPVGARRVEDFEIVGVGQSRQSRGARPVSEAHDAALVEAWTARRRRR